MSLNYHLPVWEVLLFIFLLVRLVQRLYYLMRGQKQYVFYFPRKELEMFLTEQNIHVSNHELTSKRDKIPLQYRRLGAGQKYILLANGVGTDFFMWLPFLRFLMQYDPSFFDKYTLIVQTYRGLFPPDDKDFAFPVAITVDNCVVDITEMMQHAEIKKYDAIMGWSTGAQVALACCAKYPDICDKLFLLNVSLGDTLHKAMQPIIALPEFVGEFVSRAMHALINSLKPLIPTYVWDTLRLLAFSVIFRVFLESLSFFGGFPPEQPVYFHEYMRDVFTTRSQTRGLLDLILCLDVALPEECCRLPHKAVIVSGYADFMTGVYESQKLSRTMPNAEHLCFSMGSHFLLIEWPDLVAKRFLRLLQ